MFIYDCRCAACGWKGYYQLGNPADVVYHEPVGKDVIRIVSHLPDCCPACGAEITSGRKEIVVWN